MMNDGFIQIRCVCQATLKVPASAAGKTARCPTCSATLRVPLDNGGPAASTPMPSAGFSTSSTTFDDDLDFDSLADLGSPAGVPGPARSTVPGSDVRPELLNPYRSTTATQRGHQGGGMDAAVPQNAEQIRRQYLSHEASFRSLGTLYLIGGVFGVLFAGFILLGFVAAAFGGAGNGGQGGPNNGGPAQAGVLAAVMVFWMAASVGQWFLGRGLRQLQPWARNSAAVLSGIGLFGFPFGTLISGYFLYILISAKGNYVCSDEYRAIVAATPQIVYKTSVIVWILVAIIGALLVLGIVALLLG